MHTTAPSTLTLTVLNGEPRPEKFGVLSLVISPLAGRLTTGAPGAAPNETLKSVSPDGCETLPATSVEVALAVCAPAASAAEGRHA